MTWLTWLRKLSKEIVKRNMAPARRRSAKGERLSIERLEDRITPATRTWTGLAPGLNDLWSNAANWDTNTLPVAGDTVIIPATPNSNKVIFNAGISIASLTCDEPFELQGDTLTVTGDLQMQNGRSFTLMTGGTLASATILAGTTITGTNSGGTLAGVTLRGTLDQTNNANVIVAVTGGLTLDGGVVKLGGDTAATAGNYGVLSFDGPVPQTLGGAGTVVFGNSTFNYLRAGPAPASVLIIGPNILVRGHTGTIGYHTGGFGGSTNVTFTNQGTIRADMPGGTITLNGNSWLNAGTIEATAAANPIATATQVSSTVTITTTAPHGFSGGQRVVIAGVSVAGYNGVFTISSVTSATTFTYTNTVTGLAASGGGTAKVGGNLDFRSTAAGAPAWTSSTTVSVDAGTLTVTGTVTAPAIGWSSAGITATNAVLNLGGTFTQASMGTFTRTGGTVNLAGTLNAGLTLDAATGSWRLMGGTINGGAVTTTGGAVLIATSNGGSLAGGVTLDGTLDMTTGSNVGINVTGGLILVAGSVVQLGDNGGNNGALSFDGVGSQTLGGTGTIVFGNNAFNFLRAGPTAGSILTIGPNIVVRGHTGAIGYSTNFGGFPNVTFINQGTIRADMPGGVITLNGNNWTNAGTIEATGAAIAITSATQSSSVVTITTTAPHGFSAGQRVAIAGVGVAGYDGLFTITSVANSTTFTYTNTVTGLAASGGGTAKVGGSLDFQTTAAGAPAWTSSTTVTVDAGTLTVTGPAVGWTTAGITATNSVLNLGGTFTQASLGTFTRSGGIVNITGTLNSGLTLDAATGSWRMLGGTINGGNVTTSGGAALFGTTINSFFNGGVTLDGTLDLTTGADVQVNVTGGLTLVAGSVVKLGDFSGSNYGVLSFDGVQTLGGTGAIVFSNNFFNLLRAGPIAGAVLTIGPGIVVRGHTGAVGFHASFGGTNNVAIINQGLIRAEGAFGTLTVNGTNWSNSGTIEAAGGAINLLGSWSNTGTLRSAGDTTAIAASPTGATKSGSTITITTSVAHGFVVGQSVIIAGVGLSGYNGTFTITSVPSATSFTYAASASALDDSGGGTATLNSSLSLGGTFNSATLGTVTGAGGVINLTGVVTNTAGTLTLNQSWRFLGGAINGGNVTTVGAAALIATTTASFLTNGVTFDGTLDITSAAGAFVTVTGGLTLANNAVVKIGSNTGNYGVLSFNGGTQAFGGTGSVLFGTSLQNTMWMGQTSGTSLTIGPNILVHGQSGIVGPNTNTLGGVTNSSFHNQGTIHADVANGTIKLDGLNWSNSNTIQAVAGATLTLAGSWSNNTGTITAPAASTLNLGGTFSTANLGLINSAGATVNITGTLINAGEVLTLNDTTGSWRLSGGTINGGTVVTTGTNALVATASPFGNLTSGVTIDGTLDITNVSDARVIVTGGLTLANNAVVKIGSNNNNNGVLSFNGGNQTFGGNGSVLFGNNTQNTLWTGQTAGATLTIGPNILIHGQNGVIGVNTASLSGSANAAFINQGTISADVAGGAIKLDGTNWTNSGTVEANNGGTILTAGANTNFAAGTLTGGTWKVFAGSTLRFIGAAITTNAASIVLDGANSNFFSNASPGTTSALAGFASNSAAGSFAVQNGLSLITSGPFSNAGSVTVDATGGVSTFTVTGAYTQTGGSTNLINGGVLASTTNSVLISGGTLQGSGSVAGTVTIASGATLSPGASPGIVSTTGLNLNAGSTFVVEINGFVPGADYDLVEVNGDVNLGGATLSASRLAGFVPAVGTPFTIINVTGGTVSGTFAQGNSILIGGVTFDINYAGGDGNDVVLSAQPPTVFVDDTWFGTDIGANPLNDPIGGLIFGYNAFSDIQSAINEAAVNSTVTIYGGAYTDLVNVNKVFAAITTVVNSTMPAETLVTLNGTLTLSENTTINTATANFTVNAPIDGGAALSKSGAGTLALTTANSYAGGTTLSGGVLRISADNHLGSASAVAINGGTLQIAGTFTSARTITFGGATSTIQVDALQTLTLTTPAGGAGSLTKTGAGTLDLSGLVNTFGGAGQAVNVNGGTLRISADAGLGNSANALTFNGGTLSATAGFSTSRNVALNAGGGTVDTGAFSVIFANPGVISGAGGLVKIGISLTLAGNNTFAGGVTINAGELAVSSDNNLGGAGSAVTINAGVLFVTAAFATSRTFTLGNAASTIQIASGQTLTVNSAIGGAGALGKTGAGTIVLTAVNSYVGGSRIDAGAVFVNGSIASGVIVNNTGTLAGNGAIGGSVLVNSGGTVSPGTATTTGLLAITGGYTQNAGAALNINLAGQTTPGVGFDALTVTGAASLNGSINATVVNGFSPTANDSYGVLSFASVSGDFASPTGFELGSNRFLVRTFTPMALNLVVKLQPVITSANHVALPQTLQRSFTVTTTGVPTPTLSMTGALPNGVTFVDNGNGTATLGGTPELGSLGDYPLIITAANGIGSNFDQNFLLTITIPLPVSAVNALPPFSPENFLVSWSGTDEGGPGIAFYDIFVSDNGGPFTLFQDNTTQTSAPFTGQNGHTYGFYSVATDLAMNSELPPAGAQATTIVDTFAPTSSVAALPAFSPGSFGVSWSGSDTGPAGIATYDIFVSDNGGPFTLLLDNTSQTSLTFNGQHDHVYGFYSVATDNAGNVQTTPGGAQATTEVDTAAPTSSVAVLPAFSTPNFTVSWSGSDVGGSGVASFDIFRSENGAAFTLILDNTTATSATFNGQAGQSYAFYSVATDNIGNQEATPASADAQTRTALYQQTIPAFFEDNLAPPSAKVLDLLNLHFTDANPIVKRGIAISQTSGNGTWQFSANGITWISVGAVSPGQARLLPLTYRVRFLPAKNASGPAQLYYAGWDGSFGTAGGLFPITNAGGASPFSVDVGLVNAQVNAVNDAPTWTATAQTLLVPDQTSNAAGNRIIDVAGHLFSDVDGTAIFGVAVVGLTGITSGNWEYSTNDGVIWTPFDVVSAAAARLLTTNDRIRFVANPGFNGKVAILLRAWDGSSGTPPSGVANLVGVGKIGGSAPFSANVLTVTAFVNAAPTQIQANGPAINTNEDKISIVTPVTSLLTGVFGDTPGALQGVAIVGATGPGTWQYTLNGITFLAMGAVTASSARLLPSTAKVRFVPAANQNGAGTLVYRAWDRTMGVAGSLFSITATGGATPFSSLAATSNLTVTPINDAPTWTALAQPVPFPEDPQAFLNGKTVAEVAASLFLDVDGDPCGVAVIGVTGITNGTWQFLMDGDTNWTDLVPVSASAARLLRGIDRIRFVPAPSFNGKVTILLRAWDGSNGAAAGSTANLALATTRGGTTAFSANILTVTAFVNAAPTILPAGPAMTTPEDKVSLPFTVLNLFNLAGAADTDAGALRGIAVVGASGPGTWQYSLNGTTFLPMGTVSASLARLLASTAKVRFVPATNQNGPATLTYRAWDLTAGKSGTLFSITATGGASAFSALAATSTLTIQSVNDAPVVNTTVKPFLTPVLPGSAEHAGNLVSDLLGGVTDADAGALRGIAIVALGGMTTGKWQFLINNGSDWIDVGLVSTSNALLLRSEDRIRYVPNTNPLLFTGLATLSFKAWDQPISGAAFGTKTTTIGPAFSTAIGVATVLVNTAPVLNP